MRFESISPFVRFVRQLTVESQTVFPPYIPLDTRLFYVLKGEGRIACGDREQRLPVGSILYINAGCRYQLLPCHATYLAVNFDFTSRNRHREAPVPPTVACEGVTPVPIERVMFSDVDCFHEYGCFEECHSLQFRLLQLENEYRKKLAFYRNETSALLLSVLNELARRSRQRPVEETRFDLEMILTYINRHYGEPLSNDVLAKQFHFHPNYISAECKRRLGKPLHQYVLEVRILNAVSLIESGKRNLAEIAALTGFGDTNYFSRYFKRIIGTSPGQYIRSCMKR